MFDHLPLDVGPPVHPVHPVHHAPLPRTRRPWTEPAGLSPSECNRCPGSMPRYSPSVLNSALTFTFASPRGTFAKRHRCPTLTGATDLHPREIPSTYPWAFARAKVLEPRSETLYHGMGSSYRPMGIPVPGAGLIVMDEVFVGREVELGFLRGRLEETLQGMSQTVLLEGAAGIGKTAL